MNQTSFTNKCNILAQLWMDYRHDEEFKDFIEYNDIGLPLAYLISEGIIDNPNDQSSRFVIEAFDLLLAGLDIEDTGFKTLDEMLDNDTEN